MSTYEQTVTGTMSARRSPSLLSVLAELLPSFALCALFAAVGVAHVGSRVMVVRAGYELSTLEREHRVLTREHDRLKLELATIKNPARLERLARERLSMGPPSAAQLVTVREANSPMARRGRTR